MGLKDSKRAKTGEEIVEIGYLIVLGRSDGRQPEDGAISQTEDSRNDFLGVYSGDFSVSDRILNI